VLHSCTDLTSIVKTVLLSFQDLVDFDRAMLFSINKEDFRLEPQSWVGMSDKAVKKFSVPLGFEGGDITDAIFLNKHIFVEDPDPAFDIFRSRLQSKSYIAIPLLKKPTRKCWEIRNCAKKSCQCYGSVNPYCWNNANECHEAPDNDEDTRRRSCVSCPAFMAEGVFWLDRNKSRKPITSDDITVLTNIITLAGLVFENFRMMNALDAANHKLTNANEVLRSTNYELELAQAKIRVDLEQARSIQQRLLPHDIESSGDYSVSTRYLAANTVGGDYYDLFKVADNVYGLIVADVSGHGIASALIMSMAKVLLKTYSKDELSPKNTLERINEAFLSDVATEHFVTIFYALFDVEKKKIRYTSAGHCPIIYLNKKDGTCELLKADGLFLGVFPDMMLSEKELDYVRGEHRLILYTDGLTEATNGNAEMYGAERLIAAACGTGKMDSNEALEAILKDQKDFCGDATAEDDITLLIIDF
jgi:serine phosphatase RsbU (regulator of sigma subunit)